ncbi:hypothetical protein CIK05_05455 [Bdellovibrio sp. qaytius]|nr:hypothetical protein CIK05_05455 [Bdellovibrio sp. qaytius]
MAIIGKKIGILGGGQLAQMLTQRARQMGLHVTILTADADDPAVGYANAWIKGNIFDEDHITALARHVDVITLETEFIPARTILKGLEKTKVRCVPHPNHLAILQDRWPQKELLWDYQIPTSEFIKITGKDDLEAAYKVFDGELVLKKRLSGHDGFGTFIIRTKAQFDLFKRTHKNQETQFIAEKLVHFKSEKSLIVSRNLTGDIFMYPLFHSVQKNQQCFRVWGPDHHPALNEIVKKVTALLNHLDYVGLITFELFDMGSKLLVNEIIPRVHNSGHITQDAFSFDQFEMHLRAVADQTFPLEVQATKHFLMQNIVGSSIRKPNIEVGLQGKLHWYDKKQNKPNKKLGHINYFGNSLRHLVTLADYDLKKIKT